MSVVEAGGYVQDGDEVAAGCIPLRWVGTPEPREDPRVEYALLTKRLNKRQLKILEVAQANATRPVRGRRVKRTMAPGHAVDLAHLSRSYTWGPRAGMYVVAVTFRDAEVILSSASGFQFRDESRPGSDLVLPVEQPVQIISRQAFRTVREAVESVGSDLIPRGG